MCDGRSGRSGKLKDFLGKDLVLSAALMVKTITLVVLGRGKTWSELLLGSERWS